MAFVRWRGNCAQLLATITVEGRPRHQLLANLHGAYRTSPRLWAQVATEFPTMVVDWAAVDRALAVGPPHATPPPPPQLKSHQSLPTFSLLKNLPSLPNPTNPTTHPSPQSLALL